MREVIQKVVQDLFADVSVDVQTEIPEAKYGDVSTNIAMQLAGKIQKNPREIADSIAEKLRGEEGIAKVDIAGPGFINLTLTDTQLLELMQTKPAEQLQGQTVVCEYSDMNAFKTAHVGHLFTTVIGNAIANLCEHAGANVIRANFGGDVGLHVGRAMWAIMRTIDGDPEKLNEVLESERSAWVAARYVEGTTAYESDESAKAEIIETNKQVYALHESGDRESDFARVYWTCREWSYDGFENFYDQLQLDRQPDGSYFVYYPESVTAPYGKELVEQGLSSGVFTKSDGAVVYNAEEAGLHTRVFLTSQGLPTYEAKDLGLAVKKWNDYHYEQSVIITANDITEYMKVVLLALDELLPETSGKTRHITHGLVKMVGGEKMSSRTGKVLLPQDVIQAAEQASTASSGKAEQSTVIGAIKYTFLKNRIGGDVMYDPQESVSMQGNSGPYLQYAHARARSILSKSTAVNSDDSSIGQLDGSVRLLVRKLGHWAQTVEQATAELAPHLVCTYLYELAQEFNRFYEQNQVIGSEKEAFFVSLVAQYADTLKNGLNLLGIYAPEQM